MKAAPLIYAEGPPQGPEAHAPGRAHLAGLESGERHNRRPRAPKALQALLLGLAALAVLAILLVQAGGRRLPELPRGPAGLEAPVMEERDESPLATPLAPPNASAPYGRRQLAQLCRPGNVLVGGVCCPSSRATPTRCCGEGQVYTPSGEAVDGCCNVEFNCGGTCCVSGECDRITNRCCAKGGVVKTLTGGCCPAEQMCELRGSQPYCCPAGTRCFNGLCRDTKTFSWLADCAQENLCGPAKNQLCCNSDELCWDNSRCCKAANRCGASSCCTLTQRCCGNNACCNNDQLCINGGCYAQGSVQCGSRVCGPDEDCMANNICCKRGSSLCGNTCCDLSSSVCLMNMCRPIGSTACNGQICAPGTFCFNSQTCCPTGTVGCGGRCCDGNSRCIRDTCVPSDKQMCPQGQICSSTSTCCGGSCCEQGGICLNGNTCCPSGSTICNNNCCNAGFFCDGWGTCCPVGQRCSMYFGGYGGGGLLGLGGLQVNPWVGFGRR